MYKPEGSVALGSLTANAVRKLVGDRDESPLCLRVTETFITGYGEGILLDLTENTVIYFLSWPFQLDDEMLPLDCTGLRD